jgi:fructokinase
LRNADVLKLNEAEAHEIGEMLEIGHRTLAEFCRTVVAEWDLRFCLVTLDRMGAFGVSRDGGQTYAPGYKVAVVDSLGSGDAFSAGFVHKALRSASLEEAVAFGNVLGAVVATQTGATAPIGSDDIDRFPEQEMERTIHSEFEKPPTQC